MNIFLVNKLENFKNILFLMYSESLVKLIRILLLKRNFSISVFFTIFYVNISFQGLYIFNEFYHTLISF